MLLYHCLKFVLQLGKILQASFAKPLYSESSSKASDMQMMEVNK